jgi:signal peptidase I
MPSQHRTKIWTFVSLGFVVAAWFALFAPPFVGGRTSYLIVDGTSMQPRLHTDDLVVVRAHAHYRVGDVIGFRVDHGNVIHRIVGGSARTGFVTQGDNRKEPDPWRVRPHDVLGRRWFQVPRGGVVLRYARRPLPFALIVTAAAMVPLPVRRRRHPARKERPPMTSGRLANPRAAIALSCAAVVAICSTLAVLAYREPTRVARRVQHQVAAATTSFSYTFHTTRSRLSPDGVVGPVDGADVAPVAADDGTSQRLGPAGGQGPIVFRSLVRDVDVGIDWQLAHHERATGTYDVDVTVAAVGGWSTTQHLVRDRAFSGASSKFAVSVDLAKLLDDIDAIAQETEFHAAQYEIRVTPRFHGHTTTGHPVDFVSAPTFRIVAENTRLQASDQLVVSTHESRTTVRVRDGRLWVFGANLPLEPTRIVTVTFAIVAAILGLWFGLRARGGDDVVAREAARLGVSLVDVEELTPPPSHPVVWVSSMDDLARVARTDGGIVLRHADGDTHEYLVTHDGATYRFRPVQQLPG